MTPWPAATIAAGDAGGAGPKVRAGRAFCPAVRCSLHHAADGKPHAAAGCTLPDDALTLILEAGEPLFPALRQLQVVDDGSGAGIDPFAFALAFAALLYVPALHGILGTAPLSPTQLVIVAPSWHRLGADVIRRLLLGRRTGRRQTAS